MFNSVSYNESCNINTNFIFCRCYSKFRHLDIHEEIGRKPERLNTERIQLQDREKDCTVYCLLDSDPDRFHYILVALLEWT